MKRLSIRLLDAATHHVLLAVQKMLKREKRFYFSYDRPEKPTIPNRQAGAKHRLKRARAGFNQWFEVSSVTQKPTKRAQSRIDAQDSGFSPCL
jgi:hypothetical protein